MRFSFSSSRELLFVLEPNDLSPTALGDVGQHACSFGDTLIRLLVFCVVGAKSVLHSSLREVTNRTFFPLRRPAPALCSFGNYDLNRASGFGCEIPFDDFLRNTEDAIPPTASGLRLPEVNDSRHLREPSDDGVLAAFQNGSDITDCQ